MAIGYACVAVGVPGAGMIGCTLKNAGEHKLRSMISSNLKALEVLVDYNKENGIKLFRISSDIIPFASHPVNQIPWWINYRDELMGIGIRIREAGIRVSMHPGQYTVLNSPGAGVVQNAIGDLIYHDRVLHSLGMDRSNKLVLHIGGSYGDKAHAMKTFVENYRGLPQELKDRLVIENDDKTYHVKEVLSISELTGAPVVFDNLHHMVRPPDQVLPMEYWVRECGRTWQKEDGSQKLHYSEQKIGGVPGAHSDTVGLVNFLDFYDRLPEQKPDIMLEVKDKNLSAIKCILGVKDASTKDLEQEWYRYQYFLLSRSAELYHSSKALLQGKVSGCVKEFYEFLEEAYELPENPEAEMNAAQHIWGYLSGGSNNRERNRYYKLMEAYQRGTGEIRAVKNHLMKMANLRELDDLTQSLYFYL